MVVRHTNILNNIKHFVCYMTVLASRHVITVSLYVLLFIISLSCSRDLLTTALASLAVACMSLNVLICGHYLLNTSSLLALKQLLLFGVS